MPKNKKPAGGRPAKNYVPKGAGSTTRPSFGGARSAAGSKPGARSAGHRGFRADEAGRKDRWSPEERAARNTRPVRDERGAFTTPGDRTERPRYDRDARGDRGDRGFAPRSDRGFAPREDRGDRPRYDRGDRPAQGNRFGGASRDRFTREDRPRFGGPVQGGRGGYDRSEDRPRRDSDFYPSKNDGARFTPVEDVVLERLEAKAVTADETVGLSFSELGLGDNICRQLAGMGAVSPFPIQVATIPDVLAKRDVLGRGKTG